MNLLNLSILLYTVCAYCHLMNCALQAYETLEERFEARLEEKLMQLRLEMLSVRSTDEASQTAVSSTRTDDSSQPAF